MPRDNMHPETEDNRDGGEVWLPLSAHSQLKVTSDTSVPIQTQTNDLKEEKINLTAGYTDDETESETEDEDLFNSSIAEEDVATGRCGSKVLCIRQSLVSVIPKTIRKYSGLIIKISLFIGYMIYFGFAMALTFGDEGSIRLLVMTVFGILLIGKRLITRHFPNTVKWKRPELVKRYWQRAQKIIRWLLIITTLLLAIVFLIAEIGMKKPRNLVPLGGLAFFLLCGVFCSKKPSQINWYTIYWSVALQFLLALFILRTTFGYNSIMWLTDRIQALISHAQTGSEFVFGKSYKDHGLIFGTFPSILYVNAIVAVLYYAGAIQWFVSVVGSFLRWALDISPAESVCIATNILVDNSSTAMAMKPYIEKMSRSELYMLMVAGQASVSGFFLVVVASFGVPLSYLIPACVMSAPASVTVSKLVYPDTRIKKNLEKHKVPNIHKYVNAFEAASFGAMESLMVVASVVINIYVFYGLLSLVNTTFIWFGDRIGVEKLSFEFVCSYLFWPLPVLMGADLQDCQNIGKLIGYKIMGSATLSYYQLGTMTKNRQIFQDYMTTTNGTGAYRVVGESMFLDEWNKTLAFGYITEKSETVATYALCGFSNFVTVGITLAVFSVVIPSKHKFVSKLVLETMVWANCACFMTACFAGLLY